MLCKTTCPSGPSFGIKYLSIYLSIFDVCIGTLEERGNFVREKEGDLTQSYDKTPYTNRKFENQRTTHTTPPKTLITQRLRTDLGRSVGVTSNPTGVVKPVYGIPTFPLTAKAV